MHHQLYRNVALWRSRMASRSVLWLHLIFLSRAIGLWIMQARGVGSDSYSKLHSWVEWSPLGPEVTWSILCTSAAILGIFGWWHQRHSAYLVALVFSAFVLAVISAGLFASNAVLPGLVWFTVCVCVLIEVRLYPRGSSVPEIDDDAGAEGAGV